MSKLRSDNGVYLTKALFYETAQLDKKNDAIWTLRPEHHTTKHGKEYPSFYGLYMQCVDEYDFVMQTLGNMAHWEKLCDCDWFMDGYKFPQGTQLRGLREWRKDMQQRDESEAKKQLLQAAKEGNTTAQKYLHDVARKEKVGRPEKKKVQRKAPVTGIADRFNKLQGKV